MKTLDQRVREEVIHSLGVASFELLLMKAQLDEAREQNRELQRKLVLVSSTEETIKHGQNQSAPAPTAARANHSDDKRRVDQHPRTQADLALDGSNPPWDLDTR